MVGTSNLGSWNGHWYFALHDRLESTEASAQLPNISRKLIDELDEERNFWASVITSQKNALRGSWAVSSASSLTVLPACFSAGWESWGMALDTLSRWFFQVVLISPPYQLHLKSICDLMVQQVGSHQAF